MKTTRMKASSNLARHLQPLTNSRGSNHRVKFVSDIDISYGFWRYGISTIMHMFIIV